MGVNQSVSVQKQYEPRTRLQSRVDTISHAGEIRLARNRTMCGGRKILARIRPRRAKIRRIKSELEVLDLLTRQVVSLAVFLFSPFLSQNATVKIRVLWKLQKDSLV